MGKPSAKRLNRLRVQRTFDVPLREVSGICLRRGQAGERSLIAVGDHAATVAWVRLPPSDDHSPEWKTINIAHLPGSSMPHDDPQVEAVCADGVGRVLLVQESPPRAELVDPEAGRVVASISLEVEGAGKLTRSWSDPQGSRGEGAVMLAGGHLLIAKEKDPAVLIEFGPEGASSHGLEPGGALADGATWSVDEGALRFVAIAVWRPDAALKKVCDDFSDLEIGPDGMLYLLSDQSQAIARIGALPPGGGEASATASWRLEGVHGKPEGLSFAADGCAVVALDKRKVNNNLVLLEPAICEVGVQNQRLAKVTQQ